MRFLFSHGHGQKFLGNLDQPDPGRNFPPHNKPNTPAGWIRGRAATSHTKDHRFSIIVLMANQICCHCRKHSPVCMTSVTRCWIIWNNSGIDRTF
ncbi:hypothetical protein CDAR_471281 [Caerostris darwini]|uniref:Uncharacterized protein n=1 Tax=Caerostris darwini TaxID=1538125 RepID=A0AAV4QQ16_9ARAC|nr:hypothetical protein CDAR_471281 [Caerostris darwini]